jgi:hypothetical protein
MSNPDQIISTQNAQNVSQHALAIDDFVCPSQSKKSSRKSFDSIEPLRASVTRGGTERKH